MKTRLYYIDWLRVLAFLTLILFHCAVPFVADYTWEINNKETSPWITRIIWWVHQWRLPLLFFIAGVGVRFSLKKRSIPKFFGERVVRLFIPLVFAIFFITPIQVYFEWLQNGRIAMGYLEFYPSVFEIVPYPDGSFTWSHMWFVAYLFVFTILLLPLFALSKVKGTQKIQGKIDSMFKKPILHFILAIPFVALIYGLYLDWPEQGSLIDDWYVFCSSIAFYFLGFIVSALPNFWQTCLEKRRLFLSFALGIALVLFIQFFWNWEASKPTQRTLQFYWFGLLSGIHTWMIILSCIGYAMRYLNFSSRRLQYLNSAVYPFYILHQAVIVASGYYLLAWPLPILVKFILLVVVCTGVIVLLYHFIIRKTMITRVLFGMRWNQQIIDRKKEITNYSGAADKIP